MLVAMGELALFKGTGWSRAVDSVSQHQLFRKGSTSKCQGEANLLQLALACKWLGSVFYGG